MSALRRYTPLRASRGTTIPPEIRAEVHARDQGCVGPRVGMPGACSGPVEQDHVRASHATGMKSPTAAWNLVELCRYVHHRLKTEHGRTWRPPLLDYLSKAGEMP